MKLITIDKKIFRITDSDFDKLVYLTDRNKDLSNHRIVDAIRGFLDYIISSYKIIGELESSFKYEI